MLLHIRCLQAETESGSDQQIRRDLFESVESIKLEVRS